MDGRDSDRDRDHHRAKLSYFAGDAIGSHQLDAGVEYHKLRSRGRVSRPAATTSTTGTTPTGTIPGPTATATAWSTSLYRDSPSETARDPITGEGDGWSAFAPGPVATDPAAHRPPRPALRHHGRTPTRSARPSPTSTSGCPDSGVAWDVGGRESPRAARRVEPLHAPRGDEPVDGWCRESPAASRSTSVSTFCAAQSGICDRETATAVFGPEFVHVDADGDEHFFYLADVSSQASGRDCRHPRRGQAAGTLPRRADPGLRGEGGQETSLELSYVQKEFHDQIEDTCNNNTWAWGDGEPPSLDDPSTWTDEAGCTGSVRANIDGLERDYEAVHPARRIASATVVPPVGELHLLQNTRQQLLPAVHRVRDRIAHFQAATSTTIPTNFINREGNLRGLSALAQAQRLPPAAARRHARPQRVLPIRRRAEVWADCVDMVFPSESGLAELARLGIDYDEMLQYCQSPSSGSLVLEPRGQPARRRSVADRSSAHKGFRVGKVRLVAIASVFNVTSEEAPIRSVEDPFDSRGWGTATRWQEPRRWEVGFRVEF